MEGFKKKAKIKDFFKQLYANTKIYFLQKLEFLYEDLEDTLRSGSDSADYKTYFDVEPTHVAIKSCASVPPETEGESGGGPRRSADRSEGTVVRQQVAVEVIGVWNRFYYEQEDP